MSDCGVCLRSDYNNCDGMIDDVQVVILEKDQRCCECRKIVSAGRQIEEASWYVDKDYDEVGEKRPIYTCLICAEIADAFYCEGRMYGADLWEAMEENFSALNAGCFERLKTPKAKAELQRRWMSWKGLTA
jgi:hypothetical protein